MKLEKPLWLPAKPITQDGQLMATTTFIGALTTICLQAGFNPVAALMCASGILIYLAKPTAVAAAKIVLLMKLSFKDIKILKHDLIKK